MLCCVPSSSNHSLSRALQWHERQQQRPPTASMTSREWFLRENPTLHVSPLRDSSGVSPERRATSCWNVPGLRSKTMSMKQALIDLNCFLGQYRRWWQRLVKRSNKRTQALLLLALSSSTGWRGWGSTQLLEVAVSAGAESVSTWVGAQQLAITSLVTLGTAVHFGLVNRG